MGQVVPFAKRNEDNNQGSGNSSIFGQDLDPGTVVELVVNRQIASGVPALTIYKQMETMLVSNGADFNCPKTISDFKIASCIMQGILDRINGRVTSESVLGETLRVAFDLDYKGDENTHEQFGDLLGKLV